MRGRTGRGALVALLTLALAIGLAACGSSKKSSSSSASAPSGQPGTGKPAVTLGTKNFTEEYVLGQLYLQALQAKGYKVALKNSIGPTEVTYKALTSGQIDMYPEYTGTILGEIKKVPRLPTSATATYDQAKAFVEKSSLTLTNDTPFTDRDALAVKPAYSQKFGGLKSTGDLTKVGTFRYGAPPENKTRFSGLVGMEKVYGLKKVQFKPLTIGLQYPALNSGKIDVADVFTTDGQLQRGSYVVLSDPKGIFGFQNATMLIHQSVLSKEGPEFAQTINAVSAKLTTPAMQKMNAAVDLDKQSAASVAKQFLQANGLL
jgi:osmoprotectant transport system substrate-binding protein